MENGGDRRGDRSHGNLREMPRGQSSAETAILHAHLDRDSTTQGFRATSELREKITQKETKAVQQKYG